MMCGTETTKIGGWFMWYELNCTDQFWLVTTGLSLYEPRWSQCHRLNLIWPWESPSRAPSIVASSGTRPMLQISAYTCPKPRYDKLLAVRKFPVFCQMLATDIIACFRLDGRFLSVMDILLLQRSQTFHARILASRIGLCSRVEFPLRPGPLIHLCCKVKI